MRKSMGTVILVASLLMITIGWFSASSGTPSWNAGNSIPHVTCGNIASALPATTIGLQEFQPSSRGFVELASRAGSLEGVVVPLFPKQQREPRASQLTVLVHITGLQSSADLGQRLQQPSLVCHIRKDLSHLPGVADQVQAVYPGLDPEQCWILEAGQPSAHSAIDQVLAWLSYIGLGGLGIALLLLVDWSPAANRYVPQRNTANERSRHTTDHAPAQLTAESQRAVTSNLTSSLTSSKSTSTNAQADREAAVALPVASKEPIQAVSTADDSAELLPSESEDETATSLTEGTLLADVVASWRGDADPQQRFAKATAKPPIVPHVVPVAEIGDSVVSESGIGESAVAENGVDRSDCQPTDAAGITAKSTEQTAVSTSPTDGGERRVADRRVTSRRAADRRSSRVERESRGTRVKTKRRSVSGLDNSKPKFARKPKQVTLQAAAEQPSDARVTDDRVVDRSPPARPTKRRGNSKVLASSIEETLLEPRTIAAPQIPRKCKRMKTLQVMVQSSKSETES